MIPLGITPKKFWLENRYTELAKVIINYIQAGLAVPPEWVEEYNELQGIIE